ncbi:MAG: hypothetical protein NTZ73_04795 [Candidatus Diapherotrites archaeon]|nr:hypothetical protein [Candidatus Diapherotrites archaeon]
MVEKAEWEIKGLTKRSLNHLGLGGLTPAEIRRLGVLIGSSPEQVFEHLKLLPVYKPAGTEPVHFEDASPEIRKRMVKKALFDAELKIARRMRDRAHSRKLPKVGISFVKKTGGINRKRR